MKIQHSVRVRFLAEGLSASDLFCVISGRLGSVIIRFCFTDRLVYCRQCSVKLFRYSKMCVKKLPKLCEFHSDIYPYGTPVPICLHYLNLPQDSVISPPTPTFPLSQFTACNLTRSIFKSKHVFRRKQVLLPRLCLLYIFLLVHKVFKFFRILFYTSAGRGRYGH
jgi:hypothetical protein